MTTATDAATAGKIATERMRWSQQFLEALIDSLGEDQLAARAGDAGNHALWVLGHLACTDDFLLNALNDEPLRLPESFHTRFGGGADAPSGDAADFPSLEELRETQRAHRERMLKWAESLDANTAFSEVPEMLKPFAPDAITAVMTVASHDLFHAGQIASVRAALGLKPLFG